MMLLIIMLWLCTLSLTGCTRYLKNDEKQVVKNDKTGQNLVENILCRPTNENIIKKYEENKVKICFP